MRVEVVTCDNCGKDAEDAGTLVVKMEDRQKSADVCAECAEMLPGTWKDTRKEILA